MKFLLVLSFVLTLSGNLFGQKLKIKQAENYFKTYRFAEAKLIYKELIEKDQILLDEYTDVYRHAIIAADKTHDYIFEYNQLAKLSLSKNYNFDDAFRYFQVSMFLGFYENANTLLNSPVVVNSTDPRKAILDKYNGTVQWSEFLKDTSHFQLAPTPFNSGKGEFASVYHPQGIVFSSGRSLAPFRSEMDNTAYLNMYLSGNDGTVQLLKFLESSHHDASCYYDSLNGLWYYSKNLSVNKVKPLTRTGIFIYDEKTKKEIAFPYNSPDCFVSHPFLSDDGNTLWFSSDRQGGLGKADIWYSKKTAGSWSVPVNAGSVINTIENEMFPSVQGETIYFSSNGHLGIGGLDLFSATIKDGKAESLHHMEAKLNSSADDFALVVDKTGKAGLFSSNREGYIDKVYSVKFIELNFLFKAKLVSDRTGENMEVIPVIVRNKGVVIDTLYSDASGNFEFKGERESKYIFEITNNRFEPIEALYSTEGKTKSDTTFRTIKLNSKFVTVNTLVLDEVTKKPLPNSKVDITDASTGEVKHFVSDEQGMIKVELPRNKDFDVHASHKGYIDDQSTLSTKSTDKEINDKINMTMFVKGTKIKVENVFYDYGKATLRPESKNELNRLVDFLKENPTIKVELGSHTDSRGSDAQNLQLSQKRAQACVDYLISQGIDRSLLIAKGYGETKLLNQCGNGVTCSEDEHQMNRRTEIKVLSVE